MERAGNGSGAVPLCLVPRAKLARSQFVAKEKRPNGIRPYERKSDKNRLCDTHNYPVDRYDFFSQADICRIML